LRWLKMLVWSAVFRFLLQSDASWCRHFVATAIYPDYVITCSPLAPFSINPSSNTWLIFYHQSVVFRFWAIW
jgi:hypothetical protein